MNQRTKITDGSSNKKTGQMSNETGHDEKPSKLIPLVKPSSSQYFEVIATEGINHEMRERYTEAIDYVNFCHRIMNRLLRKKCSESGDTEEYLHDFKIPETANFLSIVDLLLHHSKNSSPTKLHVDATDVGLSDNKQLNNSECEKTKTPRSVQSHRSQSYSPRDAVHPKIMNNNCKKNVNKPTNLAKTLLQNKIKQSNMGEPSNDTSALRSMDKGCNKPSFEDDYCGVASPRRSTEPANTTKMNTEEVTNPTEKHTSSQIDRANNDSPKNSDLDKYLMTIIRKQIKDFLKSPNDTCDTYVNNKKGTLDIENFKLPNNFADINLQNYSTYDEITVRKELDEISKSLTMSSSNESQSTCEYNHCVCKAGNEGAIEKDMVASSISVKDIGRLQTANYPLRRVDYTAPNIKISSIIENKRPVKRISTKPTLMNIDTNSETDDGSTIASDEESSSVDCRLNCHRECPLTCSKQDHIRSIDKVRNAFNVPKKPKASVHISKQKLSSDRQERFTHPLNINKREIHNLDKNALSQMGLFTETGDIKPDVLNILQEQSKYNQNSERSKAFRKSRASSAHAKIPHADPVAPMEEVLSNVSLSCGSSDIKSDL